MASWTWRWGHVSDGAMWHSSELSMFSVWEYTNNYVKKSLLILTYFVRWNA